VRKAIAHLSADRSTDKQNGRLLLELAGGRAEGITGEIVARAANMDDRLALGVLLDSARALGSGIAAAINLINPERVVLGGGVTKAGEQWWARVRAAARSEVLPQARVDIVPAGMSDDAPLWGAAALAENI
jgi:glucokinase